MAEKSTTVRMLGVLARVSSVVAPGLAARWLQRLFIVPRRWPTPARELDWMAGAEEIPVRLDDGRRIPIYTWGSGPVALLVHGWSSRGSQMLAVKEGLLRGGWSVATFDAPAHGAADGRRSGLPDFAKAIEAAAEAIGPVRALVAHSIGSGAATTAFARGLRVDRAVFFSPPSDPGDFLYRLARYIGFSVEVARRAQARTERHFSFLFEDARGTNLARDLDIPLLVIHDEGDVDVPYAEGVELVEAWPGARLVTTRGLGHQRILRAPEAVEAAVDFLTGGEHDQAADLRHALS